ncbi:MAG: succinate dehydrogenase, hydrophobic membrane anchor protein [Arenimonas sp.]|jgi:succinate dehydrogenase / fumarate reductase membrane anchor subunit
MNLRDPLAIARGLGSAKDGTQHWWVQRLTAVALLLLTPWFVWQVLGLIGADQYAVRETLGQPLNATLLLAYVLSMFWHAQLGMQVVIEDYVHGWFEIALQITVKFAFAFGALASALAIGRIVFSA